MTLDELRQLHTEVKTFRAWMDANTEWKTPPKEDALRFAFTEIAEALDAWLRTKGGYARNHTRNLDVYHELSDCALMLMTALDNLVCTPYPIRGDLLTLEEIAHMVSRALYEVELRGPYSHERWDCHASKALFMINDYPNMDLAAELRATMASLKEKHSPRMP